MNRIRPRVKAWREGGYPGVSGITKRLLEHWRDLEERDFRRFFFCQLEAIETLIWLVEAPPAERQGIVVPGDGGLFTTALLEDGDGTGKTIVMTMLVAWQTLNKVTYPQDTRYSKNMFVVAPGLTVRSRLQVLIPDSPGNYYDEFNIVPAGAGRKLAPGPGAGPQLARPRTGKPRSRSPRRRSVDKRGAKSDEAYVREVLGEMATARNILVINDEAHHAWRVPADSKVKGVQQIGHRGGDEMDRRAGSNPSHPGNPGLPRLHRHALRSLRQAESARRPCSTGSSATSG